MKKSLGNIDNTVHVTGQQLGNMLRELLPIFNVQPFLINFPNSFHDNTATRKLLLTNNAKQGFEVIIEPTQYDYREPYDYPFEVKLYGVMDYSLRFNFHQSAYQSGFKITNMVELEGKDEGFEKKCTDIIAVCSENGLKFK